MQQTIKGEWTEGAFEKLWFKVFHKAFASQFVRQLDPSQSHFRVPLT
jgi:hypothetical protein